MEEPSIKHISLLSIKNDDMTNSANINMALTEQRFDNVLRQEYTLSHMYYKTDQLTLHALRSSDDISPMDVDQLCDKKDDLNDDISNHLMNAEEGATCSKYSLELNNSDDNFQCLTFKPKNPKRTRNLSVFNEGFLKDRIDDLKRKITYHKTKRNKHSIESTVVSKEQDNQLSKRNIGKNVIDFKTIDLMNILKALKSNKILFLNSNVSNMLHVKQSLQAYSGVNLFINEMCEGKLRPLIFPYSVNYGMYQSLIGLIQSLLLKEHVHTIAVTNKGTIQSVSEEDTDGNSRSKPNLIAITENPNFANYAIIDLETSEPNIGLLTIDNSEEASGNKILEIDVPDIDTNPATVVKDSAPVKSNLKRKIQVPTGTKKNKFVKSGLTFADVTTFYFERSQGFSSIPTKGGSTLGMANQHFHFSTLAIDEYEYMKMQGEAKRRTNSVFYRKTDFRGRQRCVQPLNINQRIELLESAEVRIEELEENDCAYIRSSRASAGCDCKDYCYPDICGCSLAGIECQVDRPNFPCGCSRENCKNLMGRNEYNHSKVRSHFTKTIRKIRLENKGRVSKRKQASPSKVFFNNISYEMDIDLYEV